jgi:predicted transcriptional regulator
MNMAMKNTIKEFVGKRGITAYALSKRTGIPLNTVYRLVNNPKVIPSGEVMDAILNEFNDASVSDLLTHLKNKVALAQKEKETA